jgi:hypothetical protein
LWFDAAPCTIVRCLFRPLRETMYKDSIVPYMFAACHAFCDSVSLVSADNTKHILSYNCVFTIRPLAIMYAAAALLLNPCSTESLRTTLSERL